MKRVGCCALWDEGLHLSSRLWGSATSLGVQKTFLSKEGSCPETGDISSVSKAFDGGVSVDQIMQACHWKAHNTFTNSYLKDLTWSDNNNNMYLGPVVAAQVLDPSPSHQSSSERKEGTVKGTQTGFSNIHSNLLLQNLRKIDIASSLSCNLSTERLDSAINPTW